MCATLGGMQRDLLNRPALRGDARSRRRFRIAGVSTLALLGGLAGPMANAQTESADQERALETVVVTASRRAETVQDVAMSIDAIGELELVRSGITEFFDYGTKVANLSFGNGSSSSVSESQSIAIRGVSGRNTVGLYINETPLPDSLNPRIVDIERIEALRGPQGTLYGARSMGGTVRIITKEPNTETVEGAARARVSTVSEGGENYLLSGAINLPVIEDVFAIRVSGVSDRQSGLFDLVPSADAPAAFDRAEDVDAINTYGGKISGKLKLLDGRFSIKPEYMFQTTEYDGRPYADISPSNFTRERAFLLAEPSKDDWDLLSGEIRFDTGFGEIVSSTSKFTRQGQDKEEFSESASQIVQFFVDPLFPLSPAEINFHSDKETLTHETRFVSDFDGRFQATVGIYYQDDDVLNVFPGTPFSFLDDIFNQSSQTATTETALFGEFSADVTERLKLIAGARWFDSEVSRSVTQGGAFFAPLIFPDPAHPEQGTTSEKGVNPRLGVEYDYSDDVLLYANAAKGYRPGGVNAVPVSFCQADLDALSLSAEDVLSYDSDSLWSYEAGIKSTLAQGRVRANAAAFRIDWKDRQTSVGFDCAFGAVLNIGEATSQGFELELDGELTSTLTASLAVGYAKTEVTDNGGLDSAVTKGAALDQVPEWTATASGEQSFILAGHPGYLRLDWSYVDGSTSFVNDPAGRSRDSYDIVNVNSALEFGDVTIGVFANNLFDEHANLSDVFPLGVELGGRPRIAVNRPRTIGIEARLDF